MPVPANPLKAALAAGQTQIGLWLGLAETYPAEIIAGCGYDYLVIDGEHAPNDIRSMAAQIQAVHGAGGHPVVRPVIGESWIIKQLLDAGAQSLLVPLVESAAQARELVRAVRYPPAGVRGVGAALARASRFGAIDDYIHGADEQICLMLQVENRAGIAALDEILAVDGVDGVFIGPADLSADLGHRGEPQHPAVAAVIDEALARIRAAGKAPGTLAPDLAWAAHCRALGAQFIAVGIDVSLLAQGASAQLAAARATLAD